MIIMHLFDFYNNGTLIDGGAEKEYILRWNR
jgi:hypothetical protein